LTASGCNGVIRDAYDGVLSGRRRCARVRLKSFSKRPGAAGVLKECAFVVALKTILTEYPQVIAYAPNL